MEEITIRGTRAQRNLMEWSRRVSDCRSSGLSVTHWCAEHGIKPKTYCNWQKKVFAAMFAQQRAEMSDTAPRFAELPPPVEETQLAAAERQQDLVASVRIGNASLEVYGGASAEIVSALCKVLSHAECLYRCGEGVHRLRLYRHPERNRWSGRHGTAGV